MTPQEIAVNLRPEQWPRVPDGGLTRDAQCLGNGLTQCCMW
ncbi:ITGB5 isoform 9 [Pan troglodytes]|uniref:Integrin subunit beta 5 n=3 Tax=Hominidae TaxID=9604 RepID=F8WBG2_HUMAN|nr:ITGB5 isoform 9 [Pan troglodytes]PNJ05811.1 ITGB5 isoform 9 [Pongo abelii]